MSAASGFSNLISVGVILAAFIAVNKVSTALIQTPHSFVDVEVISDIVASYTQLICQLRSPWLSI